MERMDHNYNINNINNINHDISNSQGDSSGNFKSDDLVGTMNGQNSSPIPSNHGHISGMHSQEDLLDESDSDTSSLPELEPSDEVGEGNNASNKSSSGNTGSVIRNTTHSTDSFYSMFSDEEMEKLNHVREIICIDDFNMCKRLLEHHGWNLQLAINDQLEMVSKVNSQVECEEIWRNRLIKMEQDADFEETLKQDQENDRKKQEELERVRREEEEQLVRLQQRKEKIKKMKIDLISKVAEEPDPDHPDVIAISIKLPGGQRLCRRFLRSQSLQDLYYFVFCHPESPDEFNICSIYPHREIRCKPNDDPMTFQGAGLIQPTMLYLNNLDDNN